MVSASAGVVWLPGASSSRAAGIVIIDGGRLAPWLQIWLGRIQVVLAAIRPATPLDMLLARTVTVTMAHGHFHWG